MALRTDSSRERRPGRPPTPPRPARRPTGPARSSRRWPRRAAARRSPEPLAALEQGSASSSRLATPAPGGDRKARTQGPRGRSPGGPGAQAGTEAACMGINTDKCDCHLPTELLLLPEKNVIFILLVFKIYEGNKCIRYTVKRQGHWRPSCEKGPRGSFLIFERLGLPSCSSPSPAWGGGEKPPGPGAWLCWPPTPPLPSPPARDEAGACGAEHALWGPWSSPWGRDPPPLGPRAKAGPQGPNPCFTFFPETRGSGLPGPNVCMGCGCVCAEACVCVCVSVCKGGGDGLAVGRASPCV